jgi:DNA-directed RNA polymerase sigma subunit (sigma70/sigma32)
LFLRLVEDQKQPWLPDTRKKGEAADMEGISRRLRGLAPMQEKVLRLYFGLGCERTHTTREMAEEWGVSAQVIAGTLGAAQRRLAAEGLSVRE